MSEMTNRENLQDCKDEIMEEFKKGAVPDGNGSMSDVDIVLSSYCERSMLTEDELDLGVQFYAEALDELRTVGSR